MSITSLIFLLYIFGIMIVYYSVPKRYQWVVMLAASLGFYISNSKSGILFILITSSTVFAAAKWMNSISDKQRVFIQNNKASLSKEEKKEIKLKNNIKRRRILVVTLVVNFGLLCIFKYFHFALEQVNAVINLFGGSVIEDNFNLLMPLGISFYTFQSTGYLVDVYWENCKSEPNYFKTLLFVSFFPQVTQGPISEFEQLSKELYNEHNFNYENFSRGFQRMLWGFAKKMVIADSFSPMVHSTFENYNSYTGISTLIGAFFYSVQIYADFSGYMDIMCGICEMFDIRLAENFERPYFSKSIAEYWRRWHITLGLWFKKYIYYPIGVSRWNKKIGNKSKAKFGKNIGQKIPPSIALIIVWLATGLWHGASWAYIAWGGVNGLFIIFSMWMEPFYEKLKIFFKIREQSRAWKGFQVIRTFLLVTLIKVLPEVGTLSEGIGLWKHILTDHTIPTSFSSLLPFVSEISVSSAFAFALTILLFIHSLLERKTDVRNYFNRLPFAFRIFVLALLFIIIAYVGIPAASNGGFLYANF